jgi:hypothetical protein
MNLQLILALIGAGVNTAQAFATPGSTAQQIEAASGDLLAAINAVLANEAANKGKTIQEVLATL